MILDEASVLASVSVLQLKAKVEIHGKAKVSHLWEAVDSKQPLLWRRPAATHARTVWVTSDEVQSVRPTAFSQLNFKKAVPGTQLRAAGCAVQYCAALRWSSSSVLPFPVGPPTPFSCSGERKDCCSVSWRRRWPSSSTNPIGSQAGFVQSGPPPPPPHVFASWRQATPPPLQPFSFAPSSAVSLFQVLSHQPPPSGQGEPEALP
jgi:hypothetical protein